MIIYFHLRQRHHCSGAAIISLSVKSLAHKVFCLQRLRVDLKINRISQAREAVEQMCVCVCVQGPGFLYPCFKQMVQIHETLDLWPLGGTVFPR